MKENVRIHLDQTLDQLLDQVCKGVGIKAKTKEKHLVDNTDNFLLFIRSQNLTEVGL